MEQLRELKAANARLETNVKLGLQGLVSELKQEMAACVGKMRAPLTEEQVLGHSREGQ